jgi:prepilin-type N-terminal cleavage/methylation domain-containing protein
MNIDNVLGYICDKAHNELVRSVTDRYLFRVSIMVWRMEMAFSTPTTDRRRDRSDGAGVTWRGQAGFTVSELIVVVYIIGLLATLAINNALDAIEKARLARCLVEVHNIQTAIWNSSDMGVELITPAAFWASHFHGFKPGPYFYLVDGDPNAGHGNDLDDIDEQNPGDSADNRVKKDIQFVVVCQHNHKWLADYVYGEDQDPPRISLGGKDDPNYDRFVKWEMGGPGGGGTK